MVKVSDIFNEELYSVKESVTLVIPVPWIELSAGSRTMLQNLCAALKQTPPPSISYLTSEDLKTKEFLPAKMILFGHQVEGLKVHLPGNFRNSIATLTLDAADLSDDQETKKELWGAIQVMLVTGS